MKEEMYYKQIFGGGGTLDFDNKMLIDSTDIV